MFRALILALGLVVGSSGLLCAQSREDAIGIRVDLVGGGTNRPDAGISLSGSRPFGSFYGTYPAIELTSKSQHSILDVSYAFGFSRFNSDVKLDSASHTASLAFTRILSPKWKLNLTESFQMTPDFATFNVLRGVIPTSEGFRFLFDPVVLRRSTQINTASIGADRALSSKSTLSLTASHSLRNYADDPQYQNTVSDQQRTSVDVKYLRRKSERSIWNVGYTGSYFHFQRFESSHSHALSIGYSHQLSRSLVFSASAGPSYAHGWRSGKGQSGYNASLNLQSLIKSNTFALYYRHDSGDTSGLGSLSDSHSVGLGMIRPLGRKAILSIDASAFETKGTIGNPYRLRGTSAAATFGVVLNRALTLNWGGQYQRQDQSSIYAFEERRLFASLRFHTPELWRF